MDKDTLERANEQYKKIQKLSKEYENFGEINTEDYHNFAIRCSACDGTKPGRIFAIPDNLVVDVLELMQEDLFIKLQAARKTFNEM